MKWDEIYSRPGFAPRYPEPAVIRWTFRNFKRGDKLLDIGCGAGRHAIFWAENEYKAYGCDSSQVAISSLPLTVYDAAVCPCYDLPFANSSFDGALSWGVYYYCTPAQCLIAVAELYRILKPGGKALVVLRTKQDSRCTTGRKSGETYVVQAPQNCEWEAEVGNALLFHNLYDLCPLFHGFKMQFGRERRVNPSGYVHEDWLCYLEKP